MNDKQKFYELRDQLEKHKYECAEYSLFEELEKVNDILKEMGDIVECAIRELYEISLPPLVIHQDISQLISNTIF